jgi:hypothetical protein
MTAVKAIICFDPGERIRSIRSGALCTASPLAFCHVDTQTNTQRIARTAPWDALGHVLLPDHKCNVRIVRPCNQFAMGGVGFGQSRMILRIAISPWYMAS